MKKLLLLTGLLALCGLALALSLNLNVDPGAAAGATRGTETAPMLEPGVPALNYLPVQVLLPFGEKVVNVSVTLSEPELQEAKAELDWVRAQQKISQPQPDATQPDPAIWNADKAWPREDFRYMGTQSLRGYQIAVINIFPFKYNPVQQKLLASSEARIEIETAFDADTARSSANFFAPALSSAGLQGLVLNPEAAVSYQSSASFRDHAPQSRLIDLSVPKKMIIITGDYSAAHFANYIQWRDSQSVSTGLFTTADIYSAYPGTDNAEKVRNFIIDAYQTWSVTATPLEYVILGGDDEIVPERGCYGQVGNTVDQRMPTDIYFSNLDGDWNADGDNIWGEPSDNVDMLPEVHIGRFPAETAEEFANIIRKTQYYVNYNTFSNNISIMFGENLNNNPLTWGGDYKDDVATHIPESYFLQTLYQRDGNYNEQAVWNAINQGAHVMNHMGHANETYLMGQGNNTIEQLENTEYGFLYTQGCYPAAFDQRTSGDGECIAEHMSTTDGGVFAFIGNTRYGWYMPGGIDGASQFYDRQYFIGLFETLNTRFGQALSYSRQQNLNAALSNDVMRWCYYEVVLFGDPSIDVKYPDPSLPLLSLEEYSVSDIEGDGDGSINPGEILRIQPVIGNQEGWGTAYNVSVSLLNAPDGVEVIGGPLSIPQILPGQTSADDLFIRVQLAPDISYGIYYMQLALESIHPVTNLSTGIRTYNISFEITMVDNRYPWDCQIQTKSAPMVHDFDRDGDPDIMYLDVYGEAYYINEQGEDFGGWFAPPQQDI
ncbi:MAG: C25 family cysteine peptidase, partial [Candidatus Cloacimonadaceae bacterium]